jgi:hypothetical protein
LQAGNENGDGMNNNEKLRALNLLHKEQGYRVVNRTGTSANKAMASPPRRESLPSRKDNAEIRPMFRPFPMWVCVLIALTVGCTFAFLIGVAIGRGL